MSSSSTANPSPTPQEARSPNAEPPCPRLQLRWELNQGEPRGRFGGPEWHCHYELVLPLRKHDIRREVYDDEGDVVEEIEALVVALKGVTIRTSAKTPCVDTATGKTYADTPFRDGVHASWDATLLGGLPVYVIAPDGTALPVEREPDVRSEATITGNSGTNP